MSKDKVLSVKDVADMLGVHTQSIYRYVGKNKIPYIKDVITNQLKFSESDIKQWMKEREQIFKPKF